MRTGHEKAQKANASAVLFIDLICVICGWISVILQPALEDRVPHEVNTTGEVESAHRVGFVNFDGLDAQRKAGGDLFVAVAERD